MHAYTLDQNSASHRIQHRHVSYLQKQVPNAQWLVFLEVQWVPLDLVNFIKLEETLLAGGKFVDIKDSHFPEIPKVRVFPGPSYISYLGAKYRLSKV